MMNYPRGRSLLAATAITAGLLLACSSSEAEPETVSSLPVNEARATVVAPAEVPPRVYVVKKDDSLVSIAQSQDVTLAEILELNVVPDPSVIEPGLELLLPPDPAAVAAAAAAAAAANTQVPAVVVPEVSEAWYQRWVDRIPALPDQLEPARPVLLALAAVAAAIGAVALFAVGVPLVHGLVSSGASGIAFGGGRLQAAIAGGADPDRHAGEPARHRRLRPSIGWLRRPAWLGVSRSTLSVARGGVGSPGRIAAPLTVPPPSGGRDRPGFALRLGSGVAQRSRSGGAALSGFGERAQQSTMDAIRWTGRQLRLLLVAIATASRQLAQAIWRQVSRGARAGWAMPATYLHDRSDRRRRKRFREQVEADTAARMRLGLREDTEAYLQKSMDESLREGWRLEAAWCLQLMAEEADRRANHALAELRRVRARELIREHALLEEPSSAEPSPL